jgi:hypothetical protein
MHLRNASIRAHEVQHVEQSREHGLIWGGILYYYYSCVYGYQDNPMEIEAREVAQAAVMEKIQRLEALGLVHHVPLTARKRRTKANKREQRRFKGRRLVKVIHFA